MRLILVVMKHRVRFCLPALALALSVPIRAGVVAAPRLSAALEFAQANPAFRQSLLTQIDLVSSLSAGVVPSLTPLLAAAPTLADPWRAQSAALIGAYAAQPAAVAATQEKLRAPPQPEALPDPDFPR